jgi:hypothetical protein
VLTENSSLLALTSAVVNDSTGGGAGADDVLKNVDGVESIDITTTEDGGRSGERVEVKVITGAGGMAEAREVAGGAVEETGGGGAGGPSDDESVVSDRGGWLVVDASSPVLVAATGGPFWFPFGPCGPFLFFSSPGASVFTGPRAASDSRKDRGFVSL